MFLLSSFLALFGGSSQCGEYEKEERGINIRKEEMNLSLFENDCLPENPN